MKKWIRAAIVATFVLGGTAIVVPTTTTVVEAAVKAITKAQFMKVKNGMTEAQVFKILGGKGEVLSEVGQRGDQFYTIMYQYPGRGQLGANANFTFQGGKLQMKAQFGLK